MPGEDGGQPQRDARKHRDEYREQDHDDEIGQGYASNVAQSVAGQPLDHEQIEPDRRGDLGHLDDEYQENAEPDLIESSSLHDRQHDRQRHHDHGETVEEAPEDQIEYDQGDDQHEGRETEAGDEIGDRARNAEEGGGAAEDRRAEQDDRDHRAGQHGSDGDVAQRPPREWRSRRTWTRAPP